MNNICMKSQMGLFINFYGWIIIMVIVSQDRLLMSLRLHGQKQKFKSSNQSMHKKIVQDCNKCPQNFSWSTHDDVLFTAAYTFSYTDNKCHNCNFLNKLILQPLAYELFYLWSWWRSIFPLLLDSSFAKTP